MRTFAYSKSAPLPEAFATGTSPQRDGELSESPESSARALRVKQSNAERQMASGLAKPLVLDAQAPTLSAVALKRSIKVPKIDKSGIGGVRQTAGQEIAWVNLQADAHKTRWHTQGRWQADIEIATNLSRVLLAQILPTSIQRNSDVCNDRALVPVALENVWIDILLHQVESQPPALCALSMLELAAYRMVNGEVKLVKSVKSSPMPMEMISVFTLGYRLKDNKITIDICSELDRLTTTNIDIENFGETLPIVKLRSGRALPNGIFRAKYRQIVSWSA